ncbi:hypothetical protein [Streptomyces canus]|uniref:hypothetical protein n=1 Tax=Streptomyces canus TaxID=58343 RepID=UPI0036E80AD1
MNGSARDSFRNLVSIVTPPAVAGFMAAHGWQLENRFEGVKEIWRYPNEGGGSKFRVMLPLARDYEDYERRFSETLIALSRVYEFSPLDLLESINATKADVISVRLNKKGRGASVSLFEAKSVLVGFSGMIENAAIRAWNPGSSGRGRRPKQVTRYLSENLRFSRFGPESLFIVVLSMLNEEHVRPASLEPGDRTPYPRRVVSMLASDIESVRTMAGRMRSGVPVASLVRQSDVDPVAVKSLAVMSDSLDLGSIDFSFQWAVGFGKPDIKPRAYTIEREELDVMPELQRYLVAPRSARAAASSASYSDELRAPIAAAEATREVTLRGVIQGIFRGALEGAPDSVGGTAILFTTYDGRRASIRVELDSVQYSYAIEAHRQNIEVQVKGRVVGAGDKLRLQEAVFDLESLKRALGGSK